MIQETSLLAFQALVESGRLENHHAIVLDAVKAMPDSTSNEIFNYLDEKYGYDDPRYISVIRARFTELREKGLIQNVGRRPCGITGNVCLLWRAVEGETATSLRKRFSIYSEANGPDGKPVFFRLQAIPIGFSSTPPPESFWTQLLDNLVDESQIITRLEEQVSLPESHLGERVL